MQFLRLENKPTLSNDDLPTQEIRITVQLTLILETTILVFSILGSKFGSFEEAHSRNLVTVMTYHSSKGLDFKTVFIPFLNQGYEIWRESISRAKTLFFVALTRSREQLLLSYSGNSRHPFLTQSFMNECQIKNAAEEINRIQIH
jgi:ATP-dependent exoDNAse (exonuclease V) beta subunit